MKIEEKIQEAIDKYVSEIEGKEGELLAFKSKIASIMKLAEEAINIKSLGLEEEFNNNIISEEEFMARLTENKNSILGKVKKELDLIIENLNNGL